MKNKPIAPVLVGRGMAGKAILRSLAIVCQVDAELNLLPVRLVERGAPLKSYLSSEALNVLFLANPSGLHAQSIMEGAQAGFNAIAADKPVCVRSEEIPLLRSVNARVTIFHGYRAMWGARTVKNMIETGSLGDVFAFESRYWQSSSAQMALKGDAEKRPWKNDIKLSGAWDVLTDLGSHVADLCLYFMADTPMESRCWVSYRNAPARHRDTHVHLQIRFPNSKSAMASISKTVHGTTNDFEYTVIGTRGAATWRFLRPDEVEVGCGNQTTFMRRETMNPSSETSPFHGLGWLEGYAEITRQTLRQASGLSSTEIPTLSESLDAMQLLLNARIDTE
jgi:predicted dehydrogenase